MRPCARFAPLALFATLSFTLGAGSALAAPWATLPLNDDDVVGGPSAPARDVGDALAKLHPSLRDVASAASSAQRNAALGHLPEVLRDSQRVLVEIAFDAEIDATQRDSLLARVGAEPRNPLGDAKLEAWLPAERLEELASDAAVARVTPARLVRHHIGAKTSQGVASGRADLWQAHAPAFNGSGVTLAVIDGFDSLSNHIATLQTSNDWPPAARLTKLDYKNFPSGTRPSSCTTQTFGCAGEIHGNATLEIAYDVAPGATYRAYDTVTVGDWRRAIIDAANVNATTGAALGAVRANVISASLGAPLDGIGDGSGQSGSIAEAAGWARARGVLVVNSAGNERQQHWDGLYTASSGGTADHTWNGSNTPYNTFGDGSGSAYCIPDGTDIVVDMYWNNWTKSGANYVSSHDYDLYLYRRMNATTWDSLPVAQSNFPQNGGTGQTPQEQLVYTANGSTTGCASGAVYGVVVTRVLSTSNRDNLEVFANIPLTYRTAARSLSFPADSANVLTVAAIDVAKATTTPQESFSSEGPILAAGGAVPTSSAGTDPKLKPDVASFDNVTTVTFGAGGIDPPPTTSFLGTSASAPHVAGMAALFMQHFGIPTSATTLDSLVLTPMRGLAAIGTNDLGTVGKDYQYGYGRLRYQKETALAFVQQPGNTVAATKITPAPSVRVLDDEGKAVQYGVTDTATLTLGTAPIAGATLAGGGNAATALGVASWATAVIDLGGTGYKLQASATGLAAATSNAFNVTTGAATKLVFGVQPATTKAGAKITPAITVIVQDSAGNRVTSDNLSSIALLRDGCAVTPSGATAVTAVAGIATFPNVILNGTGAATLVASSAGKTSGTSNGFSITANADWLLRSNFETCTP